MSNRTVWLKTLKIFWISVILAILALLIFEQFAAPLFVSYMFYMVVGWIAGAAILNVNQYWRSRERIRRN